MRKGIKKFPIKRYNSRGRVSPVATYIKNEILDGHHGEDIPAQEIPKYRNSF